MAIDPNEKHLFGGPWTEAKLACLDKYLRAYMNVLKNQPFRTVFIDAFAGTGERYEAIDSQADQIALAPWLDTTEEQKAFFDGSARVALQVSPKFSVVALIERSQKRASKLEALRTEFQEHTIVIRSGDANDEIIEFCAKGDWSGKRTGQASRAVLFLDPYGCQVEWNTITAVAETKAIDMWYLFPSGMGINRLAAGRREQIPDSWARRLDICLGTTEWRTAFYEESRAMSLLGDMDKQYVKRINIEGIEKFFINQLQTIFPHVSGHCLRLENRTGYPMFSLCFASANPGKGGETAVRIANHLLGPRKKNG